MELSAFLQAEAPAGGHDPPLLRAEHMHRFAADLRHRERNGLALLGTYRADGQPTIATQVLRRIIFNSGRALLRDAMDTGAAGLLGLDRGFITAMPAGGHDSKRNRNPFPDDVARALADEANLAELAGTYDPADCGMRDIWEAIIMTGRRASEVLTLRLECIGRYNGLPLLWHDQTKVGNFNEAIRIPERLHDRLAERQRTTIARFADTHGGQQPSPAEKNAMALFPSTRRNPAGRRPVSYTWFHDGFRRWADRLGVGHVVAHQARHTLATRLLAHGATLSHIRRYLGHVSDRMAEHYAKVAVSEIEDILQNVWVAGPGAAEPGKLLSGGVTAMDRLQAEALALDISRRATPAEGGFCTFQPVVDGGSCPWKLNCENCDKFVLSGADLLYWRRKREQWNSIAEHAPDDATADYLHEVFAPTGRAITGLETALAGLGLLDDPQPPTWPGPPGTSRTRQTAPAPWRPRHDRRARADSRRPRGTPPRHPAESAQDRVHPGRIAVPRRQAGPGPGRPGGRHLSLGRLVQRPAAHAQARQQAARRGRGRVLGQPARRQPGRLTAKAREERTKAAASPPLAFPRPPRLRRPPLRRQGRWRAALRAAAPPGLPLTPEPLRPPGQQERAGSSLPPPGSGRGKASRSSPWRPRPASGTLTTPSARPPGPATPTKPGVHETRDAPPHLCGRATRNPQDGGTSPVRDDEHDTALAGSDESCGTSTVCSPHRGKTS